MWYSQPNGEDCAAYVPVLALLGEKRGIKVRVFGGLKKDPLNPKEKWRIPQSPPEVRTFNVQHNSHMIVFDKKAKQLGTIIENPKPENTLEEELLHIMHARSSFFANRLFVAAQLVSIS